MASRRLAGRLGLLAIGILALVAALWAALMRLGFEVPELEQELSLAHGPLMVSGFLGTLIALERAAALEKWWAYLAPLLTAAGALSLMAALPTPVGALLITLGSVGLLWNFIVLVRRETAMFTVTMALGAAAWVCGNVLWFSGESIDLLFYWWAAFPVLTIIGERLELSRAGGVSRRAKSLFAAVLAAYLAGLLLGPFSLTNGLRLTGGAMVGFAIWLGGYDVARRTIRQAGLTRFIAINLLSGYVWLALGGIFWIFFADSLSSMQYDAMLHSVFVGFVFSMIFGHAPIIFPALLRRPMRFFNAFYGHIVLLHVGLLLRIVGDLWDRFGAYQWGGVLNVLALLLFIANSARGIRAGARDLRRASGPALVTMPKSVAHA